MTLRNLAMVFGVVFTLVGVLGFVPGVTTDEGLLLGIFEVDTLHNIVHLLSGIAGLIAAKSDAHARLYLLGFGTVYAIVTLIGFMQGDTVLGLFEINNADNWLHVVLTAGLLGGGLALKPRDGGDTARPSATA